MTELIHDIRQWYRDGWDTILLAAVIDLEGSAVRGRGAVMAVRKDGLLTGSVSGGCIESTVLGAAERIFKTGKPEILTFCQIDDEILGSVSPCGGEVTIALTPLSKPFFDDFYRLIKNGKGGRLGLVSNGNPDAVGSLFALDEKGNLLPSSFTNTGSFSQADTQAFAELSFTHTTTGVFSLGTSRLFSAVLTPVPQLIIIGASHIGIALHSIARLTGYRTIVIDPRSAFTRKERFTDTDDLYRMWPRKAFEIIELTPYTAVAVITHDTKIDDQALQLALQKESFYIGALGSKSTHRDRVDRLLKAGIPQSDCDRIHSPIGLPIQSANPEEIALSIMAEVVKEFRARYGKG